MIRFYWSLYFEEEFLLGFLGWVACLCEPVLCRRRICAIVTYRSKKKKCFKNVLLWHYLPCRRQQLNLHSVRELRSQALSYDPQQFPEQSEEQKVISFFKIPFIWMTGCRQPSRDLGLCGEIPKKPGAPFVFSPSSCLHPYTFKWAMHAWLRSSREATWYKWGFLSPFFPAWRNLNEGSSLLLWDKMCLVVLQDYLWSECQQES